MKFIIYIIEFLLFVIAHNTSLELMVQKSKIMYINVINGSVTALTVRI